MTGRIVSISALVGLMVLMSFPAFAEAGQLARMMVNGLDVWFDPRVPNAGFLLSVMGPDGAVKETTFAAGQTPYVTLTSGHLEGLYQYELRVIVPARTRERGDLPVEASPVQNGSFRLLEGQIQSAANSSVFETAAAVSEAINETFSTLTIQNLNPRLDFDDTSSPGLFPSNDWALVANDTTEGGASYFAIKDQTGGTTPVRISADAPDNSLFVAGVNGFVGIGTALPVQPLHISTADSPAIRLRQTPDAQLPESVWDIASNELGIWLRDFQAGTIPFWIDPGAPNFAFRMIDSGYVGLGLDTPVRQLHLRGPNATFRMDREVDTSAFILCRTNSGAVWKGFVVGTNASGVNNGEFIIMDTGAAAGGAGTNRMQIQNNGTVVFSGNVFANSFTPTSSIAFKTNVRTLDSAMDLVSRLRGVRFDWKSNGQPAVGLIAEEVEQVIPEVVAKDENDGNKGVNYSSLVAVLVEAVKSQKQTIDKQQEDLTVLQAKVAKLEALLQAK